MIYIIANGDVHQEAFAQKPYGLLGQYNSTSDGSFRIVGLTYPNEDINALQDKIAGLYKKLNAKDAELEVKQNKINELRYENYKLRLEVGEC